MFSACLLLCSLVHRPIPVFQWPPVFLRATLKNWDGPGNEATALSLLQSTKSIKLTVECFHSVAVIEIE